MVPEAHTVNQVLEAPVKALEIALTQNLAGIRATRKRAVATVSHPQKFSLLDFLRLSYTIRE